MLKRLTIRNILFIEALELELFEGFNVLTGETGAGKSIILDSLSLALGARAESGLVKKGASQGSVIAEFEVGDADVAPILEQLAIAPSDSLMLKRVLYADGKSKAFINDIPVTNQALIGVSQTLVEIHGQHEQQHLVSPAAQLSYLDILGGHFSQKKKLAELFLHWQQVKAAYAEKQAEVSKAIQEEDYLTHVFKEIEALDPKLGEEAELSAQRQAMQARSKLMEAYASSLRALQEPEWLNERIRQAERSLERGIPEHHQESLQGIYEQLQAATNALNEAVSAIENKAEQLGGMTEEDLDKAEARLFSLKEAARKYRRPVDELAAYRDEVAIALKNISHGAEMLESLKEQEAEAKKSYAQLAETLSTARKKISEKLVKGLLKELAPLKMGQTEIEFRVENLPENRWNESGMDAVQLMIKTNAGMPFGSISKIASGGELSRFMLALKVVLAGKQQTPTMIFDEIDTGIGGSTADAVGERIKRLSEKVQVLCVTHQPQVASYAAQHLKVEKLQKKDQTEIRIRTLNEQQQQEEIARMLAGKEVTEEARAAARQLLGVAS